ncbi:16268_t:CDS:1 [Acaulospora morrowiae]|uniref:16268_t:CDS:1 n=1 Tax=Acaulospora morrowiae TaxID=94023 RepID=A0A9N9B2M5_9GLOM|nr:16268_t:CDS:1 [Acaulospora morrowiae]
MNKTDFLVRSPYVALKYLSQRTLHTLVRSRQHLCLHEPKIISEEKTDKIIESMLISKVWEDLVHTIKIIQLLNRNFQAINERHQLNGFQQDNETKQLEQFSKPPKKNSRENINQPKQKILLLPKHHNLETFLTIKEVNTSTTVYRGTLYEYETIACLQKSFGIVTRRVGKAGDDGIDFRGRWKLPGKKLMVIGQCKSLCNKCPPSAVRDLEGALCRETQETIGILSSLSGFTKGAIKRYNGSSFPLILMTVIENGTDCKTFSWNKAAEIYLDGFQVTVDYRNDSGTEIIQERPLLVYNNEKYIPDEKEVSWY